MSRAVGAWRRRPRPPQSASLTPPLRAAKRLGGEVDPRASAETEGADARPEAVT